MDVRIILLQFRNQRYVGHRYIEYPGEIQKTECQNSITGILVYWARTRQFMQILEGSEKAIID